jgi:hypothetical protein
VLPKVCQFGSYHLPLAHNVLENQLMWQDFFAAVRIQYDDTTVIMDNSLIELGTSLSADKLAQACEVVSADYLVLPDALGQCQETIDATLTAAAELEQYGQLPFKYAIVAQGQNGDQVQRCLDEVYAALGDRVGMICVPKILHKTFGSRGPVTDTIWQKFQLPVHLLGFSDSPADDAATARQPGVMGIDSAMPVWYGSMGHLVPQSPPNHMDTGPRPKNFFSLSYFNATYMAMNVNYCKGWFGDGH